MSGAHLSLIIHNNKIVDTKPYTINNNKDIIISEKLTETMNEAETSNIVPSQKEREGDQHKQHSTSMAPTKRKWALFKENGNDPLSEEKKDN
jgi:hypothetical protein